MIDQEILPEVSQHGLTLQSLQRVKEQPEQIIL